MSLHIVPSLPLSNIVPFVPPPKKLDSRHLCALFRKKLSQKMIGDFLMPIHALSELFQKGQGEILASSPELVFNKLSIHMESGEVVDCIALSDLASICLKTPSLIQALSGLHIPPPP